MLGNILNRSFDWLDDQKNETIETEQKYSSPSLPEYSNILGILFFLLYLCLCMISMCCTFFFHFR